MNHSNQAHLRSPPVPPASSPVEMPLVVPPTAPTCSSSPFLPPNTVSTRRGEELLTGLAETLAIQDLSLLPESMLEERGPGETGEGSNRTARCTPFTDRADEELLGEGFVSPPVKRTTATPLHTQGQSPDGVTNGTRRRPLSPPDLTHRNLHDAFRKRLRTESAESTPLPATADDGCWKEDATQNVAPPYTKQGEGTAPEEEALGEGGAFAPQVPVVPPVARASRPIDPFLTPPEEMLENEDAAAALHSTRPSRATRSPPSPGTKSTAVEPAALSIGTTVDGRWGRQWLPAVVIATPQNGFVQVQWREGGPPVHLRVREVRLRAAETLIGRQGQSTFREDRTLRAPFEDGSPLTATQLVRLMDEEDVKEEERQSRIRETFRAAATVADTHPEPTGDAGGIGQREEERRPVAAHRRVRESLSPMPTPSTPTELPLSALCIFLPQTVRRCLLDDTSPCPTACTQQRSADLQRILQRLASSGAVVLDSIAQADAFAGQVGDGAPTASSFTKRCVSPAAQRQSRVLGRRRKTEGHMPLPRRMSTAVNAPVSMAAVDDVQQRCLIFLVDPATEETKDAQRHLPDICIAHALGVSAVHPSWLWTLMEAQTSVKLPTVAFEVRLPKQLALPMRFSPLQISHRVLCNRDVRFLGRDDLMEVWLNAAGAMVSADIPPAHSNPASLPSASNGTAFQTVATMEVPVAPPKVPDFIYVPDDASVELDPSLSEVPLLDLPWLVEAIERHYCAAEWGSPSSGRDPPRQVLGASYDNPPHRKEEP